MNLSSFGVSYRRKGRGYLIVASTLRNSKATAPCLRGGAALLLAALSAEGESVIENADLILRGYEAPIEKLRSLGANIKMTE